MEELAYLMHAALGHIGLFSCFLEDMKTTKAIYAVMATHKLCFNLTSLFPTSSGI